MDDFHFLGIDKPAEQQGQHDAIKGVGPPGAPQRRQHGEAQTLSLIVPHAVVVGAAHLEDILTWVQIGIDGVAARAYLVPILVEAHKAIGVLIVLTRPVIERRISEREHRLAVMQNQVLAREDTAV